MREEDDAAAAVVVYRQQTAVQHRMPSPPTAEVQVSLPVARRWTPAASAARRDCDRAAVSE